jgi:hypothetical protein
VALDPHRTLFAYVHVPLPADLAAAGSLRIHQETTSNDVGLFSVWMVE